MDRAEAIRYFKLTKAELNTYGIAEIAGCAEYIDMAIAALREQEQSKAVQPIVEGASHDGEQDVAPVVHGEWKKDTTVQVMAPGGQKYHFSCSVCGYITRLHNLNYCPNCGAKMDGGKNDV